MKFGLNRGKLLKYLRIPTFVAVVALTSVAAIEVTDATDFTTLDEKVLYHADTRSIDNIQLIGPSGFIEKTTEALQYLSDVDPENYEMVKRNMSRIKYHEPIFGRIPLRETGMNVRDGAFTIGEFTVYSSLEWYASGIVHDAYHRELYRLGKPHKKEKGERAALTKQNEFLSNINHPLIDIEDTLKTRYWENGRPQW